MRQRITETGKSAANYLIVALCVFFLLSGTARAADLHYNGISFNFIGNNELEVTYLMHTLYAGYEGDIVIPGTFTDCGVTYRVTSIGERAFYRCDLLTSIVIPNTVKNIGKEAFMDCEALTVLNLPPSVETIGEEAFMWCDGLTSLTISNTVQSLGVKSFYSCKGLTQVSVNAREICDNAFYDCNALTDAYIGASVDVIGLAPFRACTQLNSITVDENNQYYDSRGDCNAIIEKATHRLVQGCYRTIIPQDVEYIAPQAFFE